MSIETGESGSAAAVADGRHLGERTMLPTWEGDGHALA